MTTEKAVLKATLLMTLIFYLSMGIIGILGTSMQNIKELFALLSIISGLNFGMAIVSLIGYLIARKLLS